MINATENASSSINEHLKSKKVHFLYQHAKVSIAGNIGISFLTMLILWNRVDSTQLLFWFFSLLTINLIRLRDSIQFEKQTNFNSSKLSSWFYKFIIYTTLSGFIWGISTWLFAPYDDPLTPLLLLIALGGISAGAAAILGSVFSVYALFIASVLLPAILWLLMHPSDVYLIFSIMSSLYVVIMMSVGYVYNGVLTRSILLAHDLVKEKENAEVANNAKTQFLSSISHEFKTPLNIILGFAQLLKSDTNPELTGAQKDDVNYILKSGNQLLSLVDNVLLVSELETGKSKISTDNITLSPLVTKCITSMQAMASEKHVTISVEDDCSYEINADKTKLSHCISNILNNAIKYNREGGNIIISSHRHGDGFVELQITDTGIGISAEQQGNLFTAFERLGNELTDIEGIGVGLYFTKQVLEAMNGKISFHSELGKGTRFSLYLPLSKE